MNEEIDEKSCRICLENDNINDLFSPCVCSGTSKYIHRKCLMEWINTNLDNDNALRCNQCLAEYKYITINKKKAFCNSCCKQTLRNKPISIIIDLLIFLLIGIITYITPMYQLLLNEFVYLKDLGFFSIYISGIFFYTAISSIFYLIILVLICVGCIDGNKKYQKLSLYQIINFHFWCLIIFFLAPLISIVFSTFLINYSRIFIYEFFFKKILVNYRSVKEYDNSEYDIESQYENDSALLLDDN